MSSTSEIVSRVELLSTVCEDVASSESPQVHFSCFFEGRPKTLWAAHFAQEAKLSFLETDSVVAGVVDSVLGSSIFTSESWISTIFSVFPPRCLDKQPRADPFTVLKLILSGVGCLLSAFDHRRGLCSRTLPGRRILFL